MGIVRVSIFQKRLPDALNLAVLKKLAALKSDFLLFPEYFFADNGARDLRTAVERSPQTLEWLLKLSDSYRGVILGGIMQTSVNGDAHCAMPLIQSSQIIDWYKKRSLSTEERSFARPGGDAGVYILGGFRFGVLAGGDMLEEKYWQELADQEVKLILTMSSGAELESEESAARLAETAKRFGMCIAVCCLAGEGAGLRGAGRSMAISPAGVTWRTSAAEKNSEILKTALLNVNG